MTSLDKIGAIPGPYGKPITVYRFKDETDPEAFQHDLDGCMDLAGIHDPARREACRKAMSGKIAEGHGVPFQTLLDHGGRKVPRATIGRPAKPATLEIPFDPKIREVADNWATLVLDQRDWTERSTALLDVLQGAMKEARSWTQTAFMGDFVHAFAMSTMVTSAIEHLAEKEIDCLEQAAFYAVTTHPEWQDAGVEWLRPFRKTWFRDWAMARPAWQDFASGMREVDSDLPAWIVKGGAA